VGHLAVQAVQFGLMKKVQSAHFGLMKKVEFAHFGLMKKVEFAHFGLMKKVHSAHFARQFDPFRQNLPCCLRRRSSRHALEDHNCSSPSVNK
jgi:hypothetical protein